MSDAAHEPLEIGQGTWLLVVGYTIHQADHYDTHTLLRYHKSTTVAIGSVSTLDGTGVPR